MSQPHHVAASAIERLSMLPPALWIVTGMPGERRSEIARALVDSFERAAHVSGDALAGAIAGGRVLPGEEPHEESERQVELAIRNQCLLARSYAEAGFTPVLEYAVLTRHQLDAYRHYLAGGRLRLVVVDAENESSDGFGLLREELGDVGARAGVGPADEVVALIRADEAAATVEG
jgi:hypothetical protein